MKKDIATILGLLLLVVLLLIFGQGFTSLSFLKQTSSTPSASQKKDFVALTVKTLNINAKIASTASDRKKGLSGKDILPLNEGLLFVFETKGSYVFWMKDMKFAIDIIWLDENKKIVDMVLSVLPEAGKKDSDLTRFRPRGEALYVLEINAGLSRLNSLEVGNTVNFEL